MKKIVAQQAMDYAILRELLSISKSGNSPGEANCGQMDIVLGSPWENSYIESFNGTFREECLNMNVSGSVEEACRIVETWRQDCNGSCSHSSLDYMTPLEFF